MLDAYRVGRFSAAEYSSLELRQALCFSRKRLLFRKGLQGACTKLVIHLQTRAFAISWKEIAMDLCKTLELLAHAAFSGRA